MAGAEERPSPAGTGPVAVDGPDRSATVRELALRLLPRSAELGEVLVQTIMARPDAYAGDPEDPVDVGDLTRSCVTNIERMCQMLAGIVPTDADPFDAPRLTGALRAEQRVPLEAVLQSYRQCGRLVWEGLVDELQTTPDGDPHALLAAAGEVWSVIDVYSHAVGEGYRAYEAERQHRDKRLRDALIVALLEGHHDGPVARAAEALDLPADGPYVCVVAPVPASGRDPMPGVLGHLAGRGIPSAWAQRASAVVGLVAARGAAGRRAVAAVLEQVVVERAAVSAPFDGLLQAAEALRGAQLALRTLPPDARGVAWLDERLPEALLARSPDLAARVVDHVFGAVEQVPGPEQSLLLETLEAYLVNGGSASATARALFCHRNTVLNRLQRLEALTGGSLRSPGHVTACVLALAARRMAEPTAGDEPAADPPRS